ncbi:MAG: DNA-3-methyladenine glycosylase 2 family protein, partial [Actinomycetota bacterium]|nr:DNA-3-methyladenine glycosylase 2 family protein [Actinomycetota bacterium]
MDPIRTRYEPHVEVSLRLTLGPLAQGSTDPTIQGDAAGTWMTMSTPSGPATVHLRSRAGGIEASAWGPGAEHAIAGVPALLGAEDDDTGFDPSRHPLVAELHRRVAGLRLTRAARVLPFLIPTILAQKVTGIEAKRAWRELVRRHGEPAPG